MLRAFPIAAALLLAALLPAALGDCPNRDVRCRIPNAQSVLQVSAGMLNICGGSAPGQERLHVATCSWVPPAWRPGAAMATGRALRAPAAPMVLKDGPGQQTCLVCSDQSLRLVCTLSSTACLQVSSNGCSFGGSANAGVSGTPEGVLPSGSVTLNGQCYDAFTSSDNTYFVPVGVIGGAGTCYQYQFGDMSIWVSDNVGNKLEGAGSVHEGCVRALLPAACAAAPMV